MILSNRSGTDAGIDRNCLKPLSLAYLIYRSTFTPRSNYAIAIYGNGR
ncbi:MULTISPECIES: hypothetical protein [unclassified Microcoleus]|nr:MULTISPECIES: hypothetical protein [unclassified Microcoleus]MCC3466046.1 hypothetical protein [Microcoleus sp. PH2017_06_SFM_O_A]MCC3551013.1 hypothetical protein [Microcoleus sp. PH2017_24_DOB_U_A]MCC3567997.1 hypothetical protein [Microcoleus sp. PH2017_31_RDM_U_A]